MQAHSDAGTLKLQDGVDPSTEKAGRKYSGHCADEARQIRRPGARGVRQLAVYIVW